MRELERLRLALEKSQSVIYEWDTEKDEITWTGDVHRLFSLPEGTPISTADQLINTIQKLDREKFKSSLAISYENGGDYRRLYQVEGHRGKLTSILDQGTVVRGKVKHSFIGVLSASPLAYYAQSRDTQQTSESLGRMTWDGGFDSHEFRATLTRTYHDAKEEGKNCVLLKISIDNLPMMITWYSLEFAHRIMEALEVNLRNMLRDEDDIFRISLDEFSIILKNHSPSEADLVIDRILRKIQLYTNPSFAEPIHLRCSIGSVRFPLDTHGVEDALNKSYLALSTAKSSAGEFHMDYNDAKREHLDSKEEVAKLTYMQSALAEDRMQIAFQPQIQTSTGLVHSYECLLRIRDEHGHVSSAGALIPIAEKLGMIDMIDHFVMEKVIEELQQAPNVKLAFNVSNMTTDNPKWLKLFTRMLSQSNVANRVIIEITETAAQHDMRQTAYFVAALQSLGCQVALDDFGAGYTSFRQLKSLSVDMVKIDGTYVIGLEEKSDNLLFIKTLLEFNHSYGLETIAECVETGEVAKILMNLGVDYMQGYYFGKPLLERPWLDVPQAATR